MKIIYDGFHLFQVYSFVFSQLLTKNSEKEKNNI